MPCPCGSGEEFTSCCGPYLDGSVKAPSAEALMRSRYSAYVKDQVDYIAATHEPSSRDDVDLEAARAWAEKAEWKGLEILRTEAGGAADDKGVVEFKAHFAMEGSDHEHHETSRFSKQEGEWFYVDGDMERAKPVVRDAPKVGRNEPCPCGSGKKYKRCCAQ